MAAFRKSLPWLLAIYIAFVFVQSLFFKFTDSPETTHIFSTIGAWLGVELFSLYGGYVIGSVELIASILLFVPRLQVVGAAIALAVMTGAIFFHLVSPLGVVVANEATGVASDGGLLFGLACGVWVAGALILWLRRAEVAAYLPVAVSRKHA